MGKNFGLFVCVSGLAHGAYRPLIARERGGAGSEGSTGSTGGGAAHKKEAPRSIDGGDVRRWHFSHESLEYDFLASPISSIRGAAATTISHLHAKGDTPIDFPLS